MAGLRYPGVHTRSDPGLERRQGCKTVARCEAKKAEQATGAAAEVEETTGVLDLN